jgi:spermidine synthase
VIDLLFFVSGFAGLALEVVWLRQLGWIAGTTRAAVALVLAVFLAGLGLGALLLGRLADRPAGDGSSGRSAFRLYGILELGIAVSGASVTILLDGIAASGAGSILWRVPQLFAALASLLLLPPTLLMGATLPVASRVAVRVFGRAGSRVSRLYAVNTLGAALGALVTGYFLIGRLGVVGTGLAATALNAICGAAAIGFAAWRASPKSASSPPAASEPRPGSISAPAGTVPPRILVLIAAGSGFTMLGYEVIWTRLLIYSAGSSVYAFAGMLAVFLLGLVGAGAAVSLRLARRGNPVLDLAVSQAVGGILALAGLLLLPALLPDNPARFSQAGLGSLFRITLAPAARLVLAPALALGMAFPLVNALRLREAERLGRDVGGVYAANTLGSIAGSLAAGFLLLPILGAARAIHVLAALNLAAAALVILTWRPDGVPNGRTAGRPRRRFLGAGLAAAALLVPVLGPGRQAVRAVTLRDATSAREPADVLVYDEGPTVTVAVVDDRAGFRDPEARRLLTDGLNMSGTTWNAKRYMRFLAHLPLLLHPSPRSVLVIGLGTGMTAGAATLHPDVAQVTTVELAAEVAAAARIFAPQNFSVLDSPKSRLVLADGRHFLRTSGDCYDVILAEPPPPRASGTVHLYSREYYLACRDALNPGGMCLQWMPLHSQGEEELRAKLATFLAVFPGATLWLPNGEEAIALGTVPGPASAPALPDSTLLAARMADPALVAALGAIGLAGPADLLACYGFGPETLSRYTRDVPLVTDRHPFTEAYLAHPRLFEPFDKLRLVTLAEPPPPALAAAAGNAQELARARAAAAEMWRGQMFKHPSQLFEALRLAPENRYFQQLCLAEPVQVSGLAAELAKHPGDRELELLRTQVLAATGRGEESLAALASLMATAQDWTPPRLLTARVALHLGAPERGLFVLSDVPHGPAVATAAEAANGLLTLALSAENATGAARVIAGRDYVNALLATRELGLARTAAARLVAAAPESPEALLASALALDRAGYPPAALPFYERLKAAHPADPSLDRARGRSLFFAGRPADALPLLAAAARRNPADPETQRLHAEALRELGRYGEAADAIAALASAAPAPEDQALARERAGTYRRLEANAARR